MFAKLPPDISERTVLLLDPMLATGYIEYKRNSFNENFLLKKSFYFIFYRCKCYRSN